MFIQPRSVSTDRKTLSPSDSFTQQTTLVLNGCHLCFNHLLTKAQLEQSEGLELLLTITFDSKHILASVSTSGWHRSWKLTPNSVLLKFLGGKKYSLEQQSPTGGPQTTSGP